MKDQLLEIRKTIEKGWTQGAYAVDKDGFQIDCDSPEACKFCLSGAINKLGVRCYDGV